MRFLRFLMVPVFAALCGAGCAQEAPKWKSRIVTDKATRASHVELSLQGIYITPPSVVEAQPVLVVQCANGKIEENYFSFGAMLSQRVGGLHPVQLEATVDNVRHAIGVQDLSPDGMSAYFPRRELKRMLVARKVLVGAVEFAGPEMLASFAMPDPAPVLSSCGHDWILKQDN